MAIKIDPSAPDGYLVHSFADDDPIKCKDYIREKCGLPQFKPNGRKRATSTEIDALFHGAVAAQAAERKKKINVVATYKYTDEAGALLYEVLRLEPKSFRQRRPDGNAGWIWNLDGLCRVIYRWPDILQYPDATVFVCEGEKDTDRVASLGHCATCVAHGKWTDDCVAALAGRDCWILEDADEAGRKKALAAATALHGTAATIRIVRLPDLTGHPNNKDVSDWLDADPRRAEKLPDVCYDAPLWTPDAGVAVGAVGADDAETSTEAPIQLPVIVPWHFHQETEPAPTAWLIKNILPETGAALISGQWGAYKTTIALDLSVAVMTGDAFAGRFQIKREGGVAYIAAEGAPGLASRLTAIARQRNFTAALPFAFRSDCPALTKPGALQRLAALIKEAAKQIDEKFGVPLVLVFIDTVVTAAGYGKAGEDNDAAMAQKAMSVLSGLSRDTGALVVGIDHFGKVSETGTRGSSAKEAHADTVLAVLADRELSGTVTNTRLAIRKHREGASGIEIPFAPKVVEVGTDPDGDPITRVVIDWNPPTAPPSDKDWSKSLQLLRRVLMTMLADGIDVQPFADGPTVRAVAVETVRTEFGKQYYAEGDARQKQHTRRMAFARAMKSAQAKGLIVTRELDGKEMVWCARTQ
jgi:hypothetical protein